MKETPLVCSLIGQLLITASYLPSFCLIPLLLWTELICHRESVITVVVCDFVIVITMARMVDISGL